MTAELDLAPMLRVDSSSRIPLATQLTNQLTVLIASGRLEAGSTLPPVRELAARLGINLHTVRAAYRMLEEDRLVDIRQGRRTTVLPYDRNVHAARAPDVPTFAIGVVLPTFSQFYGPMLEAIEKESDDPSIVLVCNAHDDGKRELHYVDQLVARRVDGIIVVSPTFDRGEVQLAGGPPVVYIDWPDADGPSVNFDLDNAGFVATEHLLGHGHDRVALIGPPAEWSNVAPKIAGYRRAHDAADLPIDPELVITTDGFGLEQGGIAAAKLLDRQDPPSAIFATADTLALGVLDEMKSRGISRSEVAVVSSDDLAIAALTNPPLTTVRLPAGEAGAMARSMLDSLKAGAEIETSSIILPTELVVRQSCGCDEVTAARAG